MKTDDFGVGFDRLWDLAPRDLAREIVVSGADEGSRHELARRTILNSKMIEASHRAAGAATRTANWTRWLAVDDVWDLMDEWIRLCPGAVMPADTRNRQRSPSNVRRR